MFQSLSDDLGHIIESSAMVLVAGGLGFYFLGTLWTGPLFVLGWYWGRETAQYEGRERKRLQLDTVKGLAYYSWIPLFWGRDGLRDFAIPTVFASAVTLLLERWI